MTIVLGFGIEAEEAMGSQILWNLKSWKNKVSPLFLSVSWYFCSLRKIRRSWNLIILVLTSSKATLFRNGHYGCRTLQEGETQWFLHSSALARAFELSRGKITAQPQSCTL